MKKRTEIEEELKHQQPPEKSLLAGENTISRASLAILNTNVLTVELLLDIRDLLEEIQFNTDRS